MTSYLLATNNKDYKKAYEHLSSQCKDKVSYDEYKDYQEQLSKIVLERNTTYENEQVLDTWVNEDGVEFKNVTKVLEKQNMKVDYKNEIVSEKSESYRYLIKEGNEYKIIWSGLFDENYSKSAEIDFQIQNSLQKTIAKAKNLRSVLKKKK